MTRFLRPLLTASFGLIMTAGCAHAPGDRAALKVARSETTIVTGSHIPQRVDPVSGLPASFSSVRIYGRQQLGETGRGYNTSAALRELDPSLGL